MVHTLSLSLCFLDVAPRGSSNSTRPVSKIFDHHELSDTASSSELKPSLRLKSDGQAVVEEAVSDVIGCLLSCDTCI